LDTFLTLNEAADPHYPLFFILNRKQISQLSGRLINLACFLEFVLFLEKINGFLFKLFSV